MRRIHSTSLAVALVACQSPAQSPATGPPDGATTSEARASLGATTAVPPRELATEMGLELDVRQQGRLVEAAPAAGAAHEAGIRTGDVLLRLGDVTLYSQDDVEDFLSLHDPGDEVRATVVRSESHRREELRVTLGAGPPRAAGGIDWQYASLAQLPAALDRARAEKKKVLVGLSGAET